MASPRQQTANLTFLESRLFFFGCLAEDRRHRQFALFEVILGPGLEWQIEGLRRVGNLKLRLCLLVFLDALRRAIAPFREEHTHSPAKLFVREPVTDRFHADNLIKIWRLSDQVRQEKLVALPKEKIFKLRRLFLGWIELARMDDFVDIHNHILEPLDRLAISLEMIAKDGGTETIVARERQCFG